MKWAKFTKSEAAGDDKGDIEWVNLGNCITAYEDEEGSWFVQCDDNGSLLGPYVEKLASVVA